MRSIFINLLLICNLVIATAQIKTDTIMIEEYNYDTPKDTFIQKDDWVIETWTTPMAQKEYAPAKDFYMIQKIFHENGMIESRGKLLGNVPFGIWEYFDENGQLIKTIDEDAKFGKIKPSDLVDIIEKVGWINRGTGETCIVKGPLKTDGSFYATIIRKLDIYYNPAQYSENGKEIEPSIWSFSYRYHSTSISYSVNGNTGEYQRYEKKLKMYE